MAIERLAEAEQELADELLGTGERHRTDHDVFHVTKTLAGLEEGHLEALAQHAERYDAKVTLHDDGVGAAGLVRAATEKGSELLGRRPEPGLLLLRDLRHLHMLAAGASLDWVALGQAAQAAKDSARWTRCLPATPRRCAP
jgi:hypothetical protein